MSDAKCSSIIRTGCQKCLIVTKIMSQCSSFINGVYTLRTVFPYESDDLGTLLLKLHTFLREESLQVL